MFRVLIFLTSISVSQTAGLHAINEHGKRKKYHSVQRAMVIANGHSDKLLRALSIRHFQKSIICSFLFVYFFQLFVSSVRSR